MIKDKVILWVSLFASLLLIMLAVFRWKLVSVLTVFIAPFISIAVGSFFFIILVSSIIYGLGNKARLKFVAFRPLLINVVAMVIYFFAPIAEWELKYDFVHNLNRRMEVVNAIQSGSLTLNKNEKLLSLPKQWHELSEDGVILCEKDSSRTTILFFTFRGVLDHFSGFIYRSDSAIPEKSIFGGNFHEIEQINNKWYWAASW